MVPVAVRAGGQKTRRVKTLTDLRKLLDEAPGLPCRTCQGRGQIDYTMHRVVPRNMNAARERNCPRCKGRGCVPDS